MDDVNIIKDKIKVFISSRCGIIKYDNMRRKLKKLLEQTGLADVYLFEEGLASSQTAEQIYLYALDDSDVCVFLIDNADGVTPAIVNEISRAKSQSKKSIYLFCNERQKEPTQIQNELTGAKGSRYHVVSSFDEFITIGYESLINDIGDIYRLYCRNRLVDQEFTDSGKTKIEIDAVPFESLGKDVLKGIDKSKAFITRQIYDTNRDIESTNELDGYCEDFLYVLFGKRSIREFNTSLLLNYLQNEQSDELYLVVESRWKAIQSYWQGDLVCCIEYLNDALIKAKQYSLHSWIIQDILIDIRNVTGRRGEEVNQYFLQSNAQKELDEMKESLYYPLLDRYTNQLYEEIDKQRIKQKTQSPYSVNLGNHIEIYADTITNIYVIAVFNGSLTHILMTLKRLKSIAFHLSEKYSDWQFRVFLLKLTISNGNKKEISSYINTFNDVFGKMNATDALEIYNFTRSIPIEHQKSIAILETFNHLGYYFAKKDYEEIQEEVLYVIENWITNNERVVAVGNHIFKALKNNHLRMRHDKIAQVFLGVITRRLYRFYDDAFDLLSYIGLEEVNDQLSEKIIMEINEIVIDKKEYNKYHKLLYAIINIRKTKEELSYELNKNALKYLPKNSKDTYKLEIMVDSDEDSEDHVLKYIDEINLRNKSQGKNGVYSGYGVDPYKIIANIMKFNGHKPPKINREYMQAIFKATTETLLSEKQLISDKISAMQLIVFMRKYCNGDSTIDYNNFYKRLVSEKEMVNNGRDSLLERHSTTTLHFNFLMIEIVYHDIDYRTFFKVLTGYNRLDEFEKIEALKALVNLLDNEYCDNLSKNALLIILQFVLSLCNEENHNVRYYSTKVLLLMLTEDTEEAILTQLSQFMDFEGVFIKSHIVDQFDKLAKVNPSITKLMIQKASVDNHYFIRKKGLEYLNDLRDTGQNQIIL